MIYNVFDVMVLSGRDVMNEPLVARRRLLEGKVLPKLAEPVRYAAPLQAPGDRVLLLVWRTNEPVLSEPMPDTITGVQRADEIRASLQRQGWHAASS
jgi:hypothetical protein